MSDLVPLTHLWRDWSQLEPGERKRRAAAAIQQEDHSTLWQLTVAHLQFTGKKGTGVSRHTLRAYERGVEDYLVYIGGADILRVSPTEAQTYVRRLEQGDEDANPKAPATVQLRVVAARRLYQALAWCGFDLENPFDKVRIAPDPVKPHEKREAYRLETVSELVAAARRFDDPVAEVAVRLGVVCGLRVEEMVTLRWRAIDFREQLITVEGKGAKRRTVPLESGLSVALTTLPKRGDHVLMRKYGGWGPYTTAGLRDKLRRLCKKAFGLDPFSGQPAGYKAFHALRHSFGEIMHEEVGLLETQAVLGHEDARTTARYAKVTSRKASERARAAQEALAKKLAQN